MDDETGLQSDLTRSSALAPGLYVTATPIGNLKDITFRAVEALKGADYILCEDTRQTAKLCAAYSIRTTRRAYHDHNGAAVRPGVIEDLKNGAKICLVSDAGTPLISDPGYKLVAEARAAGVAVYPLPGASAAIAGLSVAGLPTDQFFFAGFPPAKTTARVSFLSDLRHIKATLVFYESGGRLAAFLRESAAVMPSRQAVVMRELTKRFEEYRAGDSAELAAHYDEGGETRGEFVVFLSPPAEADAGAVDLDAFLEDALHVMSVREAAASAADALNVPKKEAYQKALSMQKQKTDHERSDG